MKYPHPKPEAPIFLGDAAFLIIYTKSMKNTYSISQAQSQFPRMVRESAGGGAIAVTRHDETVAYVVSRERMEAIVETMEILANPSAMRALHAYEKGLTRFHPLEALDDEG